MKTIDNSESKFYKNFAIGKKRNNNINQLDDRKIFEKKINTVYTNKFYIPQRRNASTSLYMKKKFQTIEPNDFQIYQRKKFFHINKERPNNIISKNSNNSSSLYSNIPQISTNRVLNISRKNNNLFSTESLNTNSYNYRFSNHSRNGIKCIQNQKYSTSYKVKSHEKNYSPYYVQIPCVTLNKASVGSLSGRKKNNLKDNIYISNNINNNYYTIDNERIVRSRDNSLINKIKNNKFVDKIKLNNLDEHSLERLLERFKEFNKGYKRLTDIDIKKTNNINLVKNYDDIKRKIRARKKYLILKGNYKKINDYEYVGKIHFTEI